MPCTLQRDKHHIYIGADTILSDTTIRATSNQDLNDRYQNGNSCYSCVTQMKNGASGKTSESPVKSKSGWLVPIAIS